MKKELIIYGLSVGLNRGAILILMPFLLHIFTLQDFGLYSYVQLVFQLVSPILSLNIIVALSREGADNPAKALYIYHKFLIPLFVCTLFFAGIGYAFSLVNLSVIYIWIVLLAGIEAWHNMLLCYFRADEKNWIFFIFSLSKTFGLLMIYALFYWLKPHADLYLYLLLQLLWYIVMGGIFHFIIRSKLKTAIKVPLKEAIVSSLILIPHTLSLWLIASAGRFFLKESLGNYELGIYSKFFNVAMVLMIINSGIGIVIPQQIIRNYEGWVSGKLRDTFFKYYSAATIGLFFVLVTGVWIDNHYFHLLKIDFAQYGMHFLYIYTGFFLLGYYYIYSNILFALRKNKTLALITTITAFFSIGVNYLMIVKFQLMGAAIAVLVTYILYYLLTFLFALSYEKVLRRSIFRETGILLTVFVILLFTTYIFAKF